MSNESRALKPVIDDVPQPVVLDNVAPATLTKAETFVSDYRVLEQIAKGMIGGSLTPSGVKNTSDVVVILMLGEELGLNYMQALRNIYVIEGRPVLSADMMAGAVKRFCDRKGGGYITVVETSAEQCTVEFMRHDETVPHTITWSMDDAKRAGLLDRKNWQRYPADMLKARALTRAARIGWPDLLGGVYDPDELAPSHPEPRQARSASSVTVNQSEPAAIEAETAAPKSSDLDPASDDALKHVREMAESRGFINDEFDQLVWFRYGIEGGKDLTTGQARELFRELKSASDEQIEKLQNDTRAAVNNYLDQQIAREEAEREKQSAK